MRSDRSYIHSPSPNALVGMTVGDVLDAAADRFADRDALVVPHQQRRLNWTELRAEARRLGAGLLARGLSAGDRVGIVAPNVVEWVATQFGTAYAGLILVNINPAYRLSELEYALQKTGCRALITVASFKTSDYVAMIRELAPEIDACEPGRLQAARLPQLEFVVTLGDEPPAGFVGYADLTSRVTAQDVATLEGLAARLDFDDPINIQFTSGTTGTPKAATLTHHNIVNNANISAELMRFSETDKLCIPVPM